MQVLKLTYPTNSADFVAQPCVLAMGFFDGVHLGHQKVIKTAKQIADEQKLPLAILTYDHHPAMVYKRLVGNEKRYLTLWERKLDLFKQLGVDLVYQINYDYAFQAQAPQEFVDNYLVKMQAKSVVAGFNHSYGAKDAAMTDLPNYANGRFEVETVQPDVVGGQPVSSTRIRQQLEVGNVENVNELLGYQFITTGCVVHGYARGRTLGFPTANIEFDDLQQIPNDGVYVVEIMINDQWHPAMASVGHNETFGDNNPMTLEINILDFNQNIYGNDVKVKWLAKLRNQVKYTGEADLIAQLKKDQLATEQFFKK